MWQWLLDTSSALSSSYHCLAGGGFWSYDGRSGAVCSVPGSIALHNPGKKVLKIGLNSHVCVTGITGSIMCGRGWDVPLQTLVRGDVVNRFNDQHSEKELSVTGGPEQCYRDWQMLKWCWVCFSPVTWMLGRIQAIDSHLWAVHKCRVFYLKFSGLCVGIHRDGFCLRAIIFFTFRVSF